MTIKTLTDDEKKKLKELFARRMELDKRQKKLQRDQENFNSELGELTGLDTTKPIDVAELMMLVL